MTLERELSANELARMLGIGKRRAKYLLETNQIPTAVRGPGRWYIQPSGVERYVEERGR